MTERFANNATTTLAAELAKGATKLTVASPARFPNEGDFRILVGSELMMVTAVSGTEFTVERAIEGSAEAAHAAGVEIENIVTAGLLSSVVTDSATEPRGINSMGVSTLDLLGYSGTEWVPADQAQIAVTENPFDSTLYIAGSERVAPTIQSQGIYIQHRVKGNLGAIPHGAVISELRVKEGSNSGVGSSAAENSLVISGGANSISHLYGVLANFKTENSPTGTVEDLRLINVQEATDAGHNLAVSTCYGLYIGAQNIGATNYSLYITGGNSVLGGVLVPASKTAQALTIKGVAEQSGNLLAIQTATSETLFEITAAGSVRIGQGLSTSAKNGFLYLPTSNGAPTGEPTSKTGTVACEYDRANDKLYVYNGGWKSVALA
ncbi:MAG TPA: hypothetical protein VFN89_03430 [Solirubrobacterales bacterium]|nr:hypothetical protein [Solirubrobacterales bacterium]